MFSALSPIAAGSAPCQHLRSAPTGEVVLAREQTISVSQKLILCDASRMGPLSPSTPATGIYSGRPDKRDLKPGLVLAKR
jgi:hypothetical protein